MVHQIDLLELGMNGTVMSEKLDMIKLENESVIDKLGKKFSHHYHLINVL